MSKLLFYDEWSDKTFRADAEEITNVLDKVCEETNKKIKDGETVYMVDVMNCIYHELGLPEDNREHRISMSSQNNTDVFRYDLLPYDDDDERETGLDLFTWFE